MVFQNTPEDLEMQTTLSKHKQGVCIETIHHSFCFKTQDKVLKCKEGFQNHKQGLFLKP